MANRKVLPKQFYLQPTLDVARQLIGKLFEHRSNDGVISGRIVEVEAYHETEPASHTYRGRTGRNEVMFRDGGYLYVYFTYGMHYCMNVVTEGSGTGAAVLIRAVEPLDGLEWIIRNRGDRHTLHNLTNGPAKVCEAFGIDRSHNGLPLSGPAVRILETPAVPSSQIEISRRIGISRATELEWRFALKDNPFVSRAKVKSG